jgi:hypothetical protein
MISVWDANTALWLVLTIAETIMKTMSHTSHLGLLLMNNSIKNLLEFRTSKLEQLKNATFVSTESMLD